MGTGYDFSRSKGADGGVGSRSSSARPRSRSFGNEPDVPPAPHSRSKDVHELTEEARRKLAFDMLMKDEDEALAKAYSAILGIRADEQAAAKDQAIIMREIESWAPSGDSVFESVEDGPAVSIEPSCIDEVDKTSSSSQKTTPSVPEYLSPQFEADLEKEQYIILVQLYNNKSVNR